MSRSRNPVQEDMSVLSLEAARHIAAVAAACLAIESLGLVAAPS